MRACGACDAGSIPAEGIDNVIIIMKLLKIIDPEKVNESEISQWDQRKAVRAIIFDNKNEIGLLYVSNKDYYKLPGGGVEEGEDLKLALDRECEEELGVKIIVLQEVGYIIEYRKQYKLNQLSYCFLAKIDSDKNNPNFTSKEKSLGFQITWVQPKEALRLLNFKKTSHYEGKFIEERDLCFLEEALKIV